MSNKPYIGVATPQANPTVEIEFRELLVRHAVPLATRLTSDGDTPHERLVEYIEQVDRAIASFDTLKLAAFAFACTGSSYLVGHRREAELVTAAEARFGLPVIPATLAIAEELALRGVSRVAFLAPYPETLIDASVRYWQEAGLTITACERIDIGADTRAIYELTPADVADALERFDDGGAELTLMSGTGMPTIASLAAATSPMLSSNLCLAAAVLRRAGAWPDDEPIDVHALVT